MKHFYITSKVLALIISCVNIALAYFVVTLLYFPNLSFHFEPFWSPFGESYTMLDVYIWLVLAIAAYLNLIFTTMEKRNTINLVIGVIGFSVNVGMCLLWQQMEIGKANVDLAVLAFSLTTTYNLLGSAVFLLARIPARSEPTNVTEQNAPTFE